MTPLPPGSAAPRTAAHGGAAALRRGPAQVVVPLSFVSEHVETLEEIDQEYREIAHEVLAPAPRHCRTRERCRTLPHARCEHAGNPLAAGDGV